MLLAPQRSSTVAGLLRLAAAWLSLILLFEGFAVAQSRAAGPLHRHQATATATATAPAGLFTHAQTHAHAETARHDHHAPADGLLTVQEVAAPDESLDATTAALSAAVALIAALLHVSVAAHAGRVWRAARPWAWLTVSRAPLLRPPRAR